MRIFGFEFKFPFSIRRDRRKDDRARIFEDLYVDFRSPIDPVHGTGEGRDISVSSVGFFSDQKLSVGIPVELTLRIAPGVLDVQKIPVRGRVIRCQKGFREKQYRVACEFEEVDEPTRQRLTTFVDWLKQREKKYLFFRYNSGE